MNEKSSKRFKLSKGISAPLTCWDIYYPKYLMMLSQASVKADMQELQKYVQKYKWTTDLDEILNAYPYQTLVLTDVAKKILWVNNGFTEMTGYPKSNAINQTPAFLQGENTKEVTKIRIRNKLKLIKPFKEVVINYRKDKTMYKCELNVFPLFGENSIHFLALEREVA